MSPVKNGDIMKRLRKMMPKTVEPAFNSPEELLQWQREQGQLRSEALERENRAMKMQRTANVILLFVMKADLLKVKKYRTAFTQYIRQRAGTAESI